MNLMVPVALFVYNRPTHLKKVLNALQANKIELLYIFSDAENNDKDAAGVGEVRKIIEQIDWVNTLVVKNKEHRGLAESIVGGISSVLNKYDKIIVLEDDCVPKEDFYAFMRNCLNNYKAEEKVFCVSGFSHPIRRSVLSKYDYDVYFWQRFWSWGWGTWRRAWDRYNPDLESLLKLVESKDINVKNFGNDIPSIIQQCSDGADAWAIKWFLTMVVNNAFSAYPKHSHIDYIGYDGSGVHCGVSDKYDVKLKAFCERREVRFPLHIEEDKQITRTITEFINTQPKWRIFQKAKNIFFEK